MKFPTSVCCVYDLFLNVLHALEVRGTSNDFTLFNFIFTSQFFVNIFLSIWILLAYAFWPPIWNIIWLIYWCILGNTIVTYFKHSIQGPYEETVLDLQRKYSNKANDSFCQWLQVLIRELFQPRKRLSLLFFV